MCVAVDVCVIVWRSRSRQSLNVCSLMRGGSVVSASRRASARGASVDVVRPWRADECASVLRMLRWRVTVDLESPLRRRWQAQSAIIVGLRSASCRLWCVRKRSSSEMVRRYLTAVSGLRVSRRDWKKSMCSRLVCRFVSVTCSVAGFNLSRCGGQYFSSFRRGGVTGL